MLVKAITVDHFIYVGSLHKVVVTWISRLSQQPEQAGLLEVLGTWYLLRSSRGIVVVPDKVPDT